MEFRDLVPYLVPVFVGVVSALVGRAVLTSSRLRKDLATDVELLAAVPPGGEAHASLASLVESRVLRLAALVRYPTLATSDFVGLLGVFFLGALSSGMAFSVGSAEEKPPDPMVVLGFPFLVALLTWSSWRFFFDGWERRAAARFTSVEEHMDAADVTELAALFRGAEMAIRLAGPVVAFGPSIALLSISVARIFSLGPLFPGLLATALFVGAFEFSVRLARRSRLNAVLPPPVARSSKRQDRPAASVAAAVSPEAASESVQGPRTASAGRGRLLVGAVLLLVVGSRIRFRLGHSVRVSSRRGASESGR